EPHHDLRHGFPLAENDGEAGPTLQNGELSDFVVDVACGTGDVAFELERVGVPLVTGIDYSSGMIAEARRKAEKRNSEVNFLEGDAMDMPFEDEKASA